MLINIVPLLIWLKLMSLIAAKEYCQFESFNISCPVNQVIVMEDARYGRLQLGRCVNRDYGFIGCSANVLDLLDRSCSGQRSCKYHIPTLRDLVQPCPRDLTSYLEASYKCVPVLNHSPLRCNTTFLLTDTSPMTHLVSNHPVAEQPPRNHHQPPQEPGGSSNVSSTTATTTTSPPLLSPSCPVIFRTRPGQRILITLYTFGQFADYDPSTPGATGAVDSSVDPKALCSHGVSVLEEWRRDTGVVYPICQVRQRVQQLLTTNGTTAALHFTGDADERLAGSGTPRRGSYILKLEAVGCPDLRSPAHAWIERFEERLVVRCNHSHETWYLTCKGTTWIGSVTNCTEAAVLINGQLASNRKRPIPFGLVIAIVVGIILGVVFGILMLLSVFFYRHRDRYSEVVKNGFCPNRRDHHLATTTLMTSATAATTNHDNDDDNHTGRHHHHHHHHDFKGPPNCLPLSSPPPLYARGGTLPRQPPLHHHHHQRQKNQYMSPILEMHCYPTSPLPPPPPAAGGVCRKCRLPSVGSPLLLRGEHEVGTLCPGCRTDGDSNPASSDGVYSTRDVVTGKGDSLISPRSITSNNINNIFCTINSQDTLGLVTRHPIPLPHSTLPRPNNLQPCPRRKGSTESTSPEKCPDLVQNGNDVSVAQTNHVIGSTNSKSKE